MAAMAVKMDARDGGPGQRGLAGSDGGSRSSRENVGALRSAARRVRQAVRWQLLPQPAKAAHRADDRGLSPDDPGIPRAIDEAIGWLCRAQDESASHDGGVAHHFGLVDGWATSYAETTGYIVPTLLAHSRSGGDDRLRQRAKAMLDWLVSIQFPEGGFRGGTVGEHPVVPVPFNTGQILLGLAAGVKEFGEYEQSLVRAADWLLEVQDSDGAWRKYASPFAEPGEKTYDTHLAWGLLEAARITRHEPYAEAALANVRWALSFQQDNGWFDKCCLSDATQPLTHTIGYVLRGVLEAYRFSNDLALLKASRKTADGLLSALDANGFLPGRLDRGWRATVPWACLTGTAQIAICWFLLHQITGESSYLEAGTVANRYLRRTLSVDGRPDVRGGVKGSFPIYGDYGRYRYLNWAGKFFVDANAIEREVGGR